MLDHAVADSRQFFQLLRFLDQLFDGFGQAVDQFGSLLITSVPANDGAVYLKELGRLPQDARDLFVVHARRL